MDAELRRLQQRLQEVQRTENAKQALNERDCVEVLRQLVDLQLVDAVHTACGKEYVTRAHLETEVVAELEGRGGRVALGDLAAAVNVQLMPHVDAAVKRVLADPRRAHLGCVLHQHELFTAAYLEGFVREVARLLTHRGRLQLSDVAARFKLDRGLVQQRLAGEVAEQTSPLHGAAIEDGALFSAQYKQRQLRRLRGALSGATGPTSIQDMVAGLADGPTSRQIMYAAVEGMIERFGGTLQGGPRGTWTPKVHEAQREASIHSVYAANGWVKLGVVRAAGIAAPEAWLERRYNGSCSKVAAAAAVPAGAVAAPSGKRRGKQQQQQVATPPPPAETPPATPPPFDGKFTGVVLDTHFVQTSLLDAAAADAAARFAAGRVWADVSHSVVPEAATEEDVRLVLDALQRGAGVAETVARARPVGRGVLVDAPAVLARAEGRVLPQVPAQVAAAFAAWREGGAGETRRGGGPSAEAVLERSKTALLDALVAALAEDPAADDAPRKPDFSSAARDLLDAFHSHLRGVYDIEVSLAARAAAASHSGGVAHIRSRDDAEHAVRASWTLLLLEAAALKPLGKVDPDATTAVAKYIIRTTGLVLLADVANIILLANGDAPRVVPAPVEEDAAASAGSGLTVDAVESWVDELPGLHKDPLVALCRAWRDALGAGDVDAFVKTCEAARDAVGVNLRSAKGPREMKELRRGLLAATAAPRAGGVSAADALTCCTTHHAAAAVFSTVHPKTFLHAVPAGLAGWLADVAAGNGAVDALLAPLRAALAADAAVDAGAARRALAEVRVGVQRALE